MNRYPEEGHAESTLLFGLGRFLSEKVNINVDPNNLILTNGGTTAIMHVGSTYLEAEDTAIAHEHSFLMYGRATNLRDCELIKVSYKEDYSYDFDALLNGIRKNTKIVYIANPNNPTGKTATLSELESFIEKVPPHVLVLVDEAYGEYANPKKFTSAVQIAPRYRVV